MESWESLTTEQRSWLAAVREAATLTDLIDLTDAGTDHGAYLQAKHRWYDLRGIELASEPATGEFPGTCVTIGSQPICIHGITHAGTDEERSYVRSHVTRLLDGGAAVYCEQGIRRLYFGDIDGVCEMDDYRWAMERCRESEIDSHLPVQDVRSFQGLVEDVEELASQLQDAVFDILDSGPADGVRAVLGDVASSFLTSHTDLATGDDFEAFRANRAAANDPSRLRALQDYYERRFLPQPLEREWLRRHDRELEVMTHARNERMADYAVYHAADAPMHLLVGAAHQPGIRYYLERHRDGERSLEAFELSA